MTLYVRAILSAVEEHALCDDVQSQLKKINISGFDYVNTFMSVPGGMLKGIYDLREFLNDLAFLHTAKEKQKDGVFIKIITGILTGAVTVPVTKSGKIYLSGDPFTSAFQLLVNVRKCVNTDLNTILVSSDHPDFQIKQILTGLLGYGVKEDPNGDWVIGHHLPLVRFLDGKEQKTILSDLKPKALEWEQSREGYKRWVAQTTVGEIVVKNAGEPNQWDVRFSGSFIESYTATDDQILANVERAWRYRLISLLNPGATEPLRKDAPDVLVLE